ncbi:unnamed protein product [Parascedosporium putredinis]|uniref:Uncharacterized protein n=1 Tax=Parascedosporium putredinis TaxID=1442378 RepID=A0A9P1GZK5_9PEZI|nr:unnamed protein product [Parascedosporium putredinis]CAI7991776.1 unnamed protein product [Parascedosporium putredinis]
MEAHPTLTIGDRARRCLNLFIENKEAVKEQVLEGGMPAEASLMDELVRFRLWISNMNVLGDVQECLDFRIKEVPEVVELFTDHLNIIENRLEQREVDEANSYDAEEDRTNKSPTLTDDPISVSVNTDVGAGSDFEQWTLSEILESVSSSISWLHRLSNLVSKAGFARQSREAQKFLLKDAEGRDSEDVTKMS